MHRRPSACTEDSITAPSPQPSPPTMELLGERESGVAAAVKLNVWKPSPPNAFGGEGWVRGRRVRSSRPESFAKRASMLWQF